MITKNLVQVCLDYFSVHQPSCGNYRNASQLWESSGHSVAAMLEHDDADYWRYHAACDVTGLAPAQRWALVRDIRDEGWRCHAACFVPDLAPARRWELVRDIQNEDWRYYAADYVPDLTDNQRAELREKR